MTLNQIDEAAYSGIDIMPRLMDDIDKLYYLAMKSMYEAYKAGALQQDEATKRKQQLRNLHDLMEKAYKAYKEKTSPLKNIVKSLGISPTTFYKKADKYERFPDLRVY